MKYLSAFTVLLLLGFTVSCYRGSFGAGYGIAEIESPEGRKLYFRREVRGINYDSLSLSQSSNYCSKPDPETALIFRSIDSHAFYKFVGEEMHIYTMSDVSMPTKLADGISVVLHKIDNHEFIQMSENYADSGLKRADVSVDYTVWCAS